MNYLNEKKMADFIRTASARQLSTIWIFASEMIYYWGMYSLESVFQTIDTYIPEIYDFVDIDKIKIRSYEIRDVKSKEKPDSDKPQIHEFLPLGFRSEIKEDIPELVTIRENFKEAYVLVPSGIEKAEAWLYPYALKATADADLEALIYFKSRGESLVLSHELSETWRKSICIDIERGLLPNNNDKKLIERAKKKEIPLVELAELFKHSIMFPCFISARDEEEDFISSTFFRAMEWFQLNEYEPWADVYAQEISTAYQGGVDEVYSLYPLFYYCRSDFLLRKASKFGLEALLYGICVGNIDPSKPWRRYWEEPDKEQRNFTYADYVPIASIIAFAWQRINPTNINKKILDQALLLLFQTQLVSGAWRSIWESAEDKINDIQLDSLYEKLKKLTNVDNATKAVHIESINERYKNKVSDVTRESANYFNPISAENEKPVAAETSEENLMRCPICTGELVLRTAKRGANAGNNFYGCSNYPKCKHIRNA